MLSVSARNIPARVRADLHRALLGDRQAGRSCFPRRKLSLTRDYSFDERTLLAKENEEAILREALARDLVGIVMRRLASL